MANDGLGQNLKPTKFGIQSGGRIDPQPRTSPDKFGQVHSADKDQTAGNVPSPQEVTRNHARSDVDSSRQSQHHTLGNFPNQAAAGDHIHDGQNGRKLGPMEMDPGNPGKTRPALTLAADAASIRAFLHNFFEFRDV